MTHSLGLGGGFLQIRGHNRTAIEDDPPEACRLTIMNRMIWGLCKFASQFCIVKRVAPPPGLDPCGTCGRNPRHTCAMVSAAQYIGSRAFIFADQPIPPGYERSENLSNAPLSPSPAHDATTNRRPSVREHRCGTFRACRPRPPPPDGGAGPGTATADRVRGRGPGIEGSRRRRKQGCVLVPRKLAVGGLRDPCEQPCSARPSHLPCSPKRSHGKASAAPDGRRGLGIEGVCDAGLRPHIFHARPVQP